MRIQLFDPDYGRMAAEYKVGDEKLCPNLFNGDHLFIADHFPNDGETSMMTCSHCQKTYAVFHLTTLQVFERLIAAAINAAPGESQGSIKTAMFNAFTEEETKEFENVLHRFDEVVSNLLTKDEICTVDFWRDGSSNKITLLFPINTLFAITSPRLTLQMSSI